MKVLFLAVGILAASSTGKGDDDKPGRAAIKEIERQRTTPTVTNVQPLLAEPHVVSIKGVVSNGVRGGWTYDAEYEFFETGAGDGAVTITLDVWSPKNATATKNVEKFATKVEIPDLREKNGRFEIVVKSADGKELGRTFYDVTTPATAETTQGR